MASFDYASALIEMVLLANVATRFEGKLEFDPIACKIINNEGANAALSREYRKGWSL
jgi:predicted HAD superfamily Cof-like phosphohydrolase